MSKPHDHATVGTYTVGFILSLIFTIIPYYLVVEKVVSGTTLLTTILGFGVIQMLVQVFFFLHLGRGPKPLYNVFFFAMTVGTILVVVGGSIIITNNLHYSMTPSDQLMRIANEEGIYEIDGKKTGACQGKHNNHQIMFMDGAVTPTTTNADKCDTLTFINHENKTVIVGFGDHAGHTPYAGVTEYDIPPGRNKTITLSETGNFTFHNHLDVETNGSFTVRE